MLTWFARHWGMLALRGVLAILFGVVALLWPHLTLKALVFLFGAYALVDGLSSLLALALRAERKPWWFAALEGVLIYRTGLFHSSTAREISNDLPVLLQRIMASPACTIDELLAPHGQIKKAIVVAANFLAEPLVDVLDAWLERLHIHAHVVLIAPDALITSLLQIFSEGADS